mmetsp:Transcript_67785/g.126591  ORF Transcript_67785/g.126591 Transcript_67785/m.126591 type:complete len:205 (+) Transcript_67785:67-681(+)
MRGSYESPNASALESLEGGHNTLNEPVTATIMRDIRSILQKLKYVMMPIAHHEKGKGLRDWDLWGPLILCLVLGSMLAAKHEADAEKEKGLAFALVFTIVWGGSGVVTLNAMLLRGNISFFQSVCVLGYCLFPLVLAEMLSALLRWLIWDSVIMKVILVAAAFAWATLASVAFMSDLVPPDRRALGVYPVGLFYAAIASLILIN